jgi:predicted dehydrogenase
MTRPSVLLVGLGRWGEKHLRVLRELGVHVWVAELAAERRAWAVRQGIAADQAVADYRTALPHVDAVDVVTPADTHLEIAETAMSQGRHCFVEKPLAVTAAEGRRLEVVAQASGRVLQVGHIFRFHPVTAALAAALDAGRLGGVRFAIGRFSGFKRPRTDVGVTQTDAIHYFDLFRHLFRRPAASVASVQRDYLGRGLDDLSLTLIHYGDVLGVVEANYFVPGTHRECVIVGESGSLVADYGTGSVIAYAGEHRRRGPVWEAVDAGKEELPTGRDEPLRLELDAFLEACTGRRPAAVTAADGVHALEIVEAAARAARLGRNVSLDEVRGSA